MCSFDSSFICLDLSSKTTEIILYEPRYISIHLITQFQLLVLAKIRKQIAVPFLAIEF